MAKEQDILNKLMAEVQEESSIASQLINKVVAEYCTDLDEAVSAIDTLLDDVEHGRVEQYSEEQLEFYGIKLPALMYRAGSKIADLGSMGDVAKAKKKEAFNNMLLRVSGTVQEKRAKAESSIENEQLIEDVYVRAYTVLNNKLEYADKLYSGVKKALSHRMSDRDLSNRDTVKRYTKED